MSDARNNNNTTERNMTKITWTTGTNQAAAVTVKHVTERHVGTVHGQAVTKPCNTIRIVATVDGKVVGSNYQRITGHPVVAAKCGKLGIIEANSARIEAAIDEIKASVSWRSYEAKVQANYAEQDEYEAAAARITAAMGTE